MKYLKAIFIILTAVFATVSSHSLLCYGLVLKLWYTPFLFFTIPLWGIAGSKIAQFLLKKLLNKNSEDYIISRQPDSHAKKALSFQKTHRTASVVVILATLISFFANVPIIMIFTSYNETYHYENFSVNAAANITGKRTGENRGTHYYLDMSWTDKNNQQLDVSLDVTKQFYDDKKIGDKVLLVYSDKDHTMVKLQE